MRPIEGVVQKKCGPAPQFLRFFFFADIVSYLLVSCGHLNVSRGIVLTCLILSTVLSNVISAVPC